MEKNAVDAALAAENWRDRSAYLSMCHNLRAYRAHDMVLERLSCDPSGIFCIYIYMEIEREMQF